MPNGSRIRANNVYGVTTDNPLTAAAATFNSISLPLLPVVASAHAVIVLDPKRVYGDPEIVVVTVHTAASTVASILRGQYGTSARSHPQGTAWAHVPINEDWVQIVTSGTRPSNPYEGQMVYEYDTHRPVQRDNTQWLPGGHVSIVTSGSRPANPYAGQVVFETDTDRILTRDAANANWVRTGWTTAAGRTGVRLRRVANQSIPNNGGAPTSISWDTEDFDSDGFIPTPSTTITIPAGLGGLYSASVLVNLQAAAVFGGRSFVDFQTPAITWRCPIVPTFEGIFTASITIAFAAGDTFSIGVFQTSGGAVNIGPSTRLEFNRIGA